MASKWFGTARKKTLLKNKVFFQLSVPCGTISTPSVREVCFASEVPAGVGGTLNFTLCVAQYFTMA